MNGASVKARTRAIRRALGVSALDALTEQRQAINIQSAHLAALGKRADEADRQHAALAREWTQLRHKAGLADRLLWLLTGR